MRRFILLGVLVLLLSVDIALAAKSKSYYDILQVSKTATDDQIKRSYRKLALKYHPDKNQDGDEESTQKFTEINNAYEVLSNKEKRSIYDQHGEEGLKRTAGQRGGGGGFAGDIFNQFFQNAGFGFGGGGGGDEEDQIPKGQDVVVDLFVSLEELYVGSTRGVWREKTVVKPASGKRKCKCRNKVAHKQIGPGMFQQYTTQECDECPNVKFEREGGEMTVEVERGMRDGQEIVFYEDGEPIIDGDPGDLKFVIREEQHEVFRRDGDNLYVWVTISLVDALTGFQEKIEHLDGHAVSIGNKGITKPKERRKFSGEGMPLLDSLKKGDLFVDFDVEFPVKLSKEQQEIIKKTLEKS